MFRGIAVVISCFALVSCFAGGGSSDSLRGDIASTGTALALQVNLQEGSDQASVAASIYIDGEKQALVGGDFFIAQSNEESSRLFSIENLSGNYQGDVSVDEANPVVTIQTEYDPEVAREDRWYPADELLVDPGANEELVGYSQDFEMPEAITSLSVNANEFDDRDDDVVLSWDAGTADQMTFNAIVNCTDGVDDFVYSRFYVLPGEGAADDGEYTLTLGEVIQNESVIDFLATLQREVTTIISYVVLEYVTLGLVDVGDLVTASEPVDVFTMQTCDVDLTLFREVGESLPEDVSSGFAISSSSASVSFTYRRGI